MKRGPDATATPAGARGGMLAAGAAAAAGRPPDFFIVGQPKSGTTALHEMLRTHPAVYMPDSKEPWFFATELHDRPPPRPGGIPETLEQYLELFADATPGQRIGEASPMYLWSRTAAARIAEVQPRARIVVIVREPASLLRSLHLQFLRSYIEVESDFRTAIELEPARRAGRRIPRRTYWPAALMYSDHVRYVEQLGRYRELFGAEAMQVLVYDDFRRDNAETVGRVLRFLDVDDTASIRPREANPTYGVRAPRLHELVHAVSVGHGPISRGVKGAIKAVTPRRLRREALYTAQKRVLYGEVPPADEEFMAELRRRFAGEVAALSEYLGRDLVELWGGDGVG